MQNNFYINEREEKNMNGVVGTNLVCQVGFIVKDIQATKKKWAEFLGVEEPEANLCGEYEIMQTQFMGAPAPEANSYLAFFDVGPGLQLELIQPNEASSTWRNYLNEHGEGIHHVAFNIQGMKMPEAVKTHVGFFTLFSDNIWKIFFSWCCIVFVCFFSVLLIFFILFAYLV